MIIIYFILFFCTVRNVFVFLPGYLLFMADDCTLNIFFLSFMLLNVDTVKIKSLMMIYFFYSHFVHIFGCHGNNLCHKLYSNDNQHRKRNIIMCCFYFIVILIILLLYY